jgi:hypothetical protein
VYDTLPMNERAAVDVMIRGGFVVLPGMEPMRVDLAINYDDALNKARPRLRDVGDLSLVVAFDTVDVSGLYLHPAPAMLTEDKGTRWMRLGAPASFTLRKGRDPSSEMVPLSAGSFAPR